MNQAASDVVQERERQKMVEGFTTEHDDIYTNAELASAAICYANTFHIPTVAGYRWPWLARWWKPTNYRRNLVKAGALIIAEIERLDRFK